MYSEFDPYRHLEYTVIAGGHWCVQIQRFVKVRPVEQSQADVDRLRENGDGPDRQDILTRCDRLDAKLDMALRYPRPELN